MPSRDDMLPDRFFNGEIGTKYGKMLKLDRDKFIKHRAAWYATLRLQEDGAPSKKLSRCLDLILRFPQLKRAESSMDKFLYLTARYSNCQASTPWQLGQEGGRCQ